MASVVGRGEVVKRLVVLTGAEGVVNIVGIGFVCVESVVPTVGVVAVTVGGSVAGELCKCAQYTLTGDKYLAVILCVYYTYNRGSPHKCSCWKGSLSMECLTCMGVHHLYCPCNCNQQLSNQPPSEQLYFAMDLAVSQ